MLIIVMANGRYTVMDNLDRRRGRCAVARVRRGRRRRDRPLPRLPGGKRDLACAVLATLDDVLPKLAERRGRLLVEVALDGSR